jgi:hypothetical protein
MLWRTTKANCPDWANGPDIDRHITWIAGNPEAPRLRDGGYRRVNLSVFPYYLAYIVRDPVIWILSVAHGHRSPEYWIRPCLTPHRRCDDR